MQKFKVSSTNLKSFLVILSYKSINLAFVLSINDRRYFRIMALSTLGLWSLLSIVLTYCLLGNKPRREPKQVIFSDGIRPGGDLTDLTEPADVIPVYRRTSRKRVEKAISGMTIINFPLWVWYMLSPNFQ